MYFYLVFSVILPSGFVSNSNKNIGKKLPFPPFFILAMKHMNRANTKTATPASAPIKTGLWVNNGEVKGGSAEKMCLVYTFQHIQHILGNTSVLSREKVYNSANVFFQRF